MLQHVRLQSKAIGERRLGIQVNEQRPLLVLRQGRAQVHDGSGFTDASLLVGDGDDSAHACSR